MFRSVSESPLGFEITGDCISKWDLLIFYPACRALTFLSNNLNKFILLMCKNFLLDTEDQ